MKRLLRAAASAALACGAAVAAAAGWNLTLPDGRRVAIVIDAAADPPTHTLERHHPDGSLDRQFGVSGRVPISLGAGSPGPRSIRSDSSGRLLVVGAALAADGRSIPGLLRLLPDGKLDLSWGVQGRALLSAASDNAVGVDALPLPDGTVLVLGQAEGAAAEQAALWLLGSNGSVDVAFGVDGILRATALEFSDGLALQLDDDGAALVAVQTAQQGVPWLEVHRWQVGQDQPLRVARQPMPADWQGPVTLARRGGMWQWFDASQPVSNGGVPLVAVAATAAWRIGAAPEGGARAAPQNNPSEGGAAWNPFSVGAPTPTLAEPSAETYEPPWTALAVVAFLALAGWAWWRWPPHQAGRGQRAGAVSSGAVIALDRGHAPAASGGGPSQVTRWRERYLRERRLRADVGVPPTSVTPDAAVSPGGEPPGCTADSPGIVAGHDRRHQGARRPRRGSGDSASLQHWPMRLRQRQGTVVLYGESCGLGRAQDSGEWLRRLKQWERRSPRALRLQFILEGRAAQLPAVVRAWLARHPRIELWPVADSTPRPRRVRQLLGDSPHRRRCRGPSADGPRHATAGAAPAARLNADPRPPRRRTTGTKLAPS